MNVDDRLLMSYVDGLLSTKQRARVERLLMQSGEAAARVDALSASRLPYQEAFESFASLAVPHSLARSIDALVDSHDERLHTPQPRKRGGMAWLAVAFFVGVMSSSAGFQMFSNVPAVQSQVQGAAPAWVQAVVSYQTLYARDTLSTVKDDRTATTQLVSTIQRDDGMPLRVPDLSAERLTFKRVQRLNYHNARLIQMVYLPERGQPVALCVMADAHPDQAPRAQQVGDMNTVTWRRGQLAYVLAAKGSAADLQQLATKIADGKVRPMYG